MPFAARNAESLFRKSYDRVLSKSSAQKVPQGRNNLTHRFQRWILDANGRKPRRRDTRSLCVTPTELISCVEKNPAVKTEGHFVSSLRDLRFS